ncbi:MAG TPA: TetR/AcrR family transcriptional regulator [Acidimicrobiia bacterium]|nr:TetR/AcrR family transcriptional regulator [Acidimicrobiia bacterium]
MDRLPADSPRLRRLLGDLESLMVTEGFLHLNTDDIARRLRCSKATLYRLAPSREELFEFVIERSLARMRDQGRQEVAAQQTWEARFVAFLIEPIRRWTTEVSYHFVRDLQAFPGGKRLWLAHETKRMETLEEIIAAGAAEGAFQPVHARLAADLILTTVKRALEPDFAASMGLSINEAFEEWYRVLEFGLICNATDAERAEAMAVVASDLPPRRNGRAKTRRPSSATA